MNLRSLFLFGISIVLVSSAEGRSQNVRRVPPPGIQLSASDRTELERGVEILGQEIEHLRTALKGKPLLLDLLPDVLIYEKAVRWPLIYDEFLRTNDAAAAKLILQQGLERAKSLREDSAPWTTSTGLVVRGYISKIDGSVQPYGLVVPASYRPGAGRAHRLDVWLHGRDNNLTELKFINDRQRSAGEFTPPDAFVLHPCGRYCNAFKFAGEVDVFEALEHARKHYPIDGRRLTMRGFSMGGAGCWHLAAHHAGTWAAAAPGAGFAETADYTKALSKDPKPAWFEQKLWHLYDATDYAPNLFNCPVVAYSGELDKQKQAADMMAQALAGEGLQLTHIIGPKTEHRYHPQSKLEISRRIDGLAERGRDPLPKEVRFTTWTLRYHQLDWVKLDGLDRHWERARVRAEIVQDNLVNVQTENVSALTLEMPAGLCPFDNTRKPAVAIDGSNLTGPSVLSDRSWTAHFRKQGGRWAVVEAAEGGGLQKRPGLQGPIDDAFMDSFIMVRPTGNAMNDKIGAWLSAAMDKALRDWRAQFRGEARIVNDDAVTEADLASSNLILWGDPSGNRFLAKIADKLPIRWNKDGVRMEEQIYPPDQHVAVMVYPNPLNPKRYVVLNSGFTFSEVGHLSNALQTPKLPDFAVLNIEEKTSSRSAARIVNAGFFDEQWQLPK
jgi:hypothetical protein